MVTKKVNGIEYDVNIEQGNELYFETSFYKKCNSTGINDILSAVYKEREKYTPESLFIELTGKCNFNCPFCYIHTCNNINQYSFKPFDEMKNDIDYLLSNGLMTCTISGGECFLHPDFSQIYEYLKTNGILVTVLTNLSLLDSKLIDLFSKLPPYKIDVSIYAIENEAMYKITNQNKVNSQVVLENILKLKKAGINITCKTPYNQLTRAQIPLISEWCKQHNIPYFYSMETFDNYDGKKMNKFSMSSTEVMADRIAAKKNKLKSNYKNYSKKLNFMCKGGEYGLFISYDYYLRPCMPFYAIEEANFDINKYGIKEALNKMKQFIYKYRGTPLLYCNGCDASNLCDLCIITQLSKNNQKEYMQAECKKIQSFI